MGFRKDAYATVWSVESINDVNTKCRISISRKNRQTGEYEEDFSGFVSFFGSAAAKKALQLKERDRIKLGDVDVRSKYVKEKNTTYYNFNVYSFETQAEMNGGNSPGHSEQLQQNGRNVDDGEVDDSRLPF